MLRNTTTRCSRTIDRATRSRARGETPLSSEDSIATFYEAHPYPPPVRDLDGYRDRWADSARRRVEFQRHFPAQTFDEHLNILVAGCGTSQAARHALRWPQARVTGIDVSVASLRATDDLKQRYELDHLTLDQLPIERVAELGETYDLIICTGVLHHLADPPAALHELRNVLAQDGALNLMVYGLYGRSGVSMMQEYARLLAVDPTPTDIEDFADTLREVPMAHPISPTLRDSPDFRSPGALADALLNPREVAYSVPEVLDLVETAGLRFARWQHQAPYRPGCGAPAVTPHAGRLAQLPDRDQFAAMELFRGTMSRHTLITVRDDSRTRPVTPVTRDTVPLRIPDAITLEERLPEGAAAALVNTAHTSPDLVMIVTEREKSLLDAIDGSRSIAEIIDASDLGSPPAQGDVLAFFERLWLWDQIVLDQSHT